MTDPPDSPSSTEKPRGMKIPGRLVFRSSLGCRPFSSPETPALMFARWNSRCVCRFVLVGWLAMVNVAAASSAEPDAASAEAILALGQRIYNDTCLDCHGADGVGQADVYDQPLVGDASVGELAQIIAETMPEGDPDACVGDEAAAVSAYIHAAFYGEAAQLRRRPPRAVLQRLTGTQMRQSLTDLYAATEHTLTTARETMQAKQGLKATYFNGPRWDKKNLKIERVDPVVDFRWGHDSPGGDIGAEEFFVHWEGGLRVPQTGRYEIVVRSDCSFELSLGDRDDKLIDNHVQSEGRTEFRRFVTLTGGRVYPIWIDLNQRKRKTEQPPANITLAWVPPGGVEQVIPATHLYSDWCPNVLRLETEFPPDDRSYGFERGLSIDAAWDDAVGAAAFELADRLITYQWEGFARQAEKKKRSRREALRDFLTPLMAAAHRMPVAAVGPLLDRAAGDLVDEKEIIKRTVLMAVKNPRFLYPQLDLDRSVSQQAVDRLSLVLHDSLPAEPYVIQEIQKDRFTTPGSLDWLIDRMVDDSRTRAKVRDLFTQWLELDKHEDLRKSEERFAGFGPEVIADLHGSLETFLDATLWSDTSDFRQLLLADSMPTTPLLAQYYGEAWQPTEATGATGQPVLPKPSG